MWCRQGAERTDKKQNGNKRSQCICQWYQKRKAEKIKTALKKNNMAWTTKLLQRITTLFHSILCKITNSYGYCPKLTRSPRFNACKLACLNFFQLKWFNQKYGLPQSLQDSDHPSFYKKILGTQSQVLSKSTYHLCILWLQFSKILRWLLPICLLPSRGRTRWLWPSPSLGPNWYSARPNLWALHWQTTHF